MNREKIILDLCGGTGSWSKPYREAGYDVRIITLPENDITKTFFVGDYIHFPSQKNYQVISRRDVWGILAAPPCTMFSFARTNAKRPRDLKEGMNCIHSCFTVIWFCQELTQETGKKSLPLKFWALENPARGFLKNFLGKSAFIFNPYDFGDGYKKETALWGNFNEPKKIAGKITKGMVKFDKLKSKEIHGERFGELTRTERRAITPQGFAKAFFEANP